MKDSDNSDSTVPRLSHGRSQSVTKSEVQKRKSTWQDRPSGDSRQYTSRKFFLELVQLVWRSVHAGVPPLTISSTSEIFSMDSRTTNSPLRLPLFYPIFFFFLQWINNDRRLTFLLNNSRYNRNYIKKLNVMDINKSRKIFNLIAYD